MSADTNEIKLYTLKEVSEILSVTERTVLNQMKAGRIKGQKLCGRWRFTQNNLTDFINGK